jgi:riboflavin synthase
MFTGIVVEVGRLAGRVPVANGMELEIEAPLTAPRLVLGASVAVNGVCQTVTALAPPIFRVQAVGATIERTTLGTLATGSRLNIEPSLRMGDELGGHLVMGHVDGTAVVREITPKGEAVYLGLSLPREIVRFAAPRGSLAIDGTSLTIAGIEADRVVFSLIPHTLVNTIAHTYRIGDRVNVEVDLLARYVDRLLGERTAATADAVTLEILKEKFS